MLNNLFILFATIPAVNNQCIAVCACLPGRQYHCRFYINNAIGIHIHHSLPTLLFPASFRHTQYLAGTIFLPPVLAAGQTEVAMLNQKYAALVSGYLRMPG
jgi:hypothetical protein